VYYQAYDGMPKMIRYATNTWQVMDLGNGKSLLKMKMDFNVGGMMGKMMKGMMKKKLSKLGTQLANDFKYYVENGKPTAKKQKAIAKYNSKTKHS
jgi:carbon monoxide dehydrogenase subunit G